MRSGESIFEQAGKLLKSLKMDAADAYSNDVAISVIRKYGSIERVFEELAKNKYDRLRYTPEIMLTSMIDIEDDIRNVSEELANKLHSLRSIVMVESNVKGVDFEELFDKIDVVHSLSLSVREAWAVKFAGGKDFIKRLNTFQNGDKIIDLLMESLRRADEHIANMKEGKSIASTTSASIAGFLYK
ncbi:hypothetical protein [Sulfuricurvum sp.]|uniref:hypothetical protein n=1 Tax=Sulfuricurvum sp. TaxID=2025608 RepID=UPI003BB53F80